LQLSSFLIILSLCGIIISYMFSLVSSNFFLLWIFWSHYNSPKSNTCHIQPSRYSQQCYELCQTSGVTCQLLAMPQGVWENTNLWKLGESILLGEKVCASYVTSRQHKINLFYEYVYQKLWPVNLTVLGLLFWSANYLTILFQKNLQFPSIG
jgi:hypothetical protein